MKVTVVYASGAVGESEVDISDKKFIADIESVLIRQIRSVDHQWIVDRKGRPIGLSFFVEPSKTPLAKMFFHGEFKGDEEVMPEQLYTLMRGEKVDQ